MKSIARGLFVGIAAMAVGFIALGLVYRLLPSPYNEMILTPAALLPIVLGGYIAACLAPGQERFLSVLLGTLILLVAACWELTHPFLLKIVPEPFRSFPLVAYIVSTIVCWPAYIGVVGIGTKLRMRQIKKA